MSETVRSFGAVVQVGAKRRVFVPLPFAPNDAWGVKAYHHVAGTVDSMPVRAVVEEFAGGYGIVLGPGWRRGCGIAPCDSVEVVLSPQGTAAR